MTDDLKGLWTGHVRVFDELASTNTWMLEHAGEVRHGDVVWARAQTTGRGRFARPWLSLPRRSLTISCALREEAFIPLGPNIGQFAACAVADTLARFGLPAALKWPNDVMVADRKIAGILVELAEAPAVLVLGIGLNVNGSAEDFRAAALDRPAISMQASAGNAFDVDAVLRVLLGQLQVWLDRAAAGGLALLRERWATSDWLAGHDIEVQTAAGPVTGHYGGLDELGRLRLARTGGEEALWSGDVMRVRRAGGAP